MELKDRLKELREANKLTQSELASKLNGTPISDDDPKIYPQTISLWENGREPSLNAIKKIALYYRVSSDYLLGLSEEDNFSELMYSTEDIPSLTELKEQIGGYPPYVKSLILDRLQSYYSIFSKEKGEWTESELIRFYYLSEITSIYSSILYNKIVDEGARSNKEETVSNIDIFMKKVEMVNIVKLTNLMTEFIEVIYKRKNIFDVIKFEEDRKDEKTRDILEMN